MNLEQDIQDNLGFKNLDFLAKQIVEGFISGIHKSPFHGFSSEFAEHKIYNAGENTKHIDWKLYAKTDKLYTKKYDDETNLRCHFILDNSSSMHYPKIERQSIDNYNKIGFSVMAIASLMQLLKKQRDAMGLSVFDKEFQFYTPEKGNNRHYAMLMNKLESLVKPVQNNINTDVYSILHQIAEKLNKRSLVVLFSDMFQTSVNSSKLFEALQHLKHNKHDVILFHTLDYAKEIDFDFTNSPKRFFDIETESYIDIHAEDIKLDYQKRMKQFINELKINCLQYGINYIPIDVQQSFNVVLTQFLIQRQKFA